MPKPSVPDQLTRADQLQAAIAVLQHEIHYIEAEGTVAPPGCRVMRYQLKRKNGCYWYYKLQALEPIFPTSSKSGRMSKYKHLGKAGSREHIAAVLNVARRSKLMVCNGPSILSPKVGYRCVWEKRQTKTKNRINS